MIIVPNIKKPRVKAPCVLCETIISLNPSEYEQRVKRHGQALCCCAVCGSLLKNARRKAKEMKIAKVEKEYGNFNASIQRP